MWLVICIVVKKISYQESKVCIGSRNYDMKDISNIFYLDISPINQCLLYIPSEKWYLRFQAIDIGPIDVSDRTASRPEITTFLDELYKHSSISRSRWKHLGYKSPIN